MALVPLYRLLSGADHFYTTSVEERDNAVSQFGYALEGVACYVEDAPGPSTEDANVIWRLASSAAIAALSTNPYFNSTQIASKASDIADSCVAEYLTRNRG